MSNSITVKFDLRIVCGVLIAIIVVMLAIWQPWHQTSSTTRKITITGDATVTGTPDEFVFYPSFQKTGVDNKQLAADLNAYGNKLQQDLMKLGVAEKDITLDSSSYDDYPIAYDTVGSQSNNQTFTLSATITTHNKDQAQKVQDYLATTDAKGQITPQAQFSNAKQKQLSNEARLKAIADAQSKADATAKSLHVKVGKVLTISDDSAGGVTPRLMMGANIASDSATTTALPVTASQSEVNSTVTVTFSLK